MRAGGMGSTVSYCWLCCKNNQSQSRPTNGWDQIKVTEKIRVVVFANGHLANFSICRATFAKAIKEWTPTLARFPVLKGPIRGQTMRAKQVGHFPMFNCPTLTPHATSVSQKRWPCKHGVIAYRLLCSFYWNFSV